jgi:hypothetical protein
MNSGLLVVKLIGTSIGSQEIHIKGMPLRCKKNCMNYHISRYGDDVVANNYTLRLTTLCSLDHNEILVGDVYKNTNCIDHSSLLDYGNSKKFTVLSDSKYFMNSSQMNQLPVMPIYDTVDSALSSGTIDFRPGDVLAFIYLKPEGKIDTNPKFRIQLDLNFYNQTIVDHEQFSTLYQFFQI